MPLHQSGDTCINYRCYNTSLKAKKKKLFMLGNDTFAML